MKQAIILKNPHLYQNNLLNYSPSEQINPLKRRLILALQASRNKSKL
jgi:hypothetical protein